MSDHGLMIIRASDILRKKETVQDRISIRLSDRIKTGLGLFV
jgi:hypothetical protein